MLFMFSVCRRTFRIGVCVNYQTRGEMFHLPVWLQPSEEQTEY